MTESRQPYRILIVDDEPANIKVFSELLSERYEVFGATSGPVALILAEEVRPDLILLDVIMPEMDGYDVCRAIKADPLLHDIPVIFVTSRTSEEDECVGLGLGAVDYLFKPFRLAIVGQRVAIHLELKRQRDLLARQALVDGLTGIPNRRAFDECLEREWRRGLRNGECLSLVLIDIDNFKNYNDTNGHPAGDECLRRIAQTLRGTLNRVTDFVGRYGGEEFACILPGSDGVGLKAVAEKLRVGVASLRIPHAASTAAPYVTISLGAACLIPTRDSGPESLVMLADQQLYQAKQQGRNRVSLL